MSLLDKARDALFIVEHDPNPIAYDVETSGLSWKRNSIVGYVITGVKTLAPYAWPKSGLPEGLLSVYVPVRHGGGGNLVDAGVPALTTAEDEPVEHYFERDLKEAFKRRALKAKENPGSYITVGHNIGFDAHFSWKHQIMLGRELRDTQVQATMLDEHQDSFSLERTAVVFGATPKLGKAMYAHISKTLGIPNNKATMGEFWRMSGADPVTVDYAEGDGYTTLEVYHKQLPFIEEEELTYIVSVENRLIWTLVRMEQRGIKLAEDKFEYVLAEANRLLAAAQAKLPYGFNVRSPAAVRALAERVNYTNWAFTAPTDRFPNGQPQLNEAFLAQFPEGQAILRVRQIEKLIGSFIMPLMEKHNWKGRVHGHLNQLKSDEFGTISGRLSASDPNLQQLPARDEELATLVRLLLEADAGMTMYEFDYSQVEPRLWAIYSRDQYLVEGYNATPPRDVHTVAAALTGVTRQEAKPLNLGLFYTMGKKTLLSHMLKYIPGLTRADTDPMHVAWYANFTSIGDFQNDATSVLRNRGYVRTILGRRSRVSDFIRKFRKFYVAPNRIIQGGSADIIKERLLYIDMAFEDAGDIWQLLMTIHDSIVVQGPDDDHDAPLWIKATMEDLRGPPYNLKLVPFVVDMSKGKNWAEVKFGKDHD